MKALQIPAKLYFLLNTTSYGEKYAVHTSDLSQHIPSYVLLETREATFEFSEPEPIEIIGKQVDALRAKKDQIAAESMKQQRLIEDQIQQLLCIDHTRMREELDEHMTKVAETLKGAVTVNEASKVHASISREIEAHRKAADAKGDKEHAQYLSGRLRRLTTLKDERIAALSEEKAS